jgi:hypothetical protein
MRNVVSVRTQPCNGAEARQLGREKCIPTFSIGIPVVAAGSVVFVVLLVALIVFVIRNKKMADQYELLLQGSSVQGNSRSANIDEVVSMDDKDEDANL